MADLSLIIKIARSNVVSSNRYSVSPDLILIDGRFRVASFLYSLMSARLGTTIFSDDYHDRRGYHVVERYCELKALAGRAGIFQVERQYTFTDIAECFAKYSIIPN